MLLPRDANDHPRDGPLEEWITRRVLWQKNTPVQCMAFQRRLHDN